MGSQVDHPPWEGRLGAQERVSGRLVSDLPPPYAIFLGCERHHDKVGGLEVACRVCGCKYAAAATEGSTFEAERGAL